MTGIRRLAFDKAAFGDHVVCLGAHIARVIEAISERQPALVWYAGDVSAVGGDAVWPATATPVRLGDGVELARIARTVDQFLSGVFAAFRDDDNLAPRFRDGGLWTEDPPDADLGSALVEVRAFDATYVEVISRDGDLLVALAARLGGAVEWSDGDPS